MVCIVQSESVADSIRVAIGHPFTANGGEAHIAQYDVAIGAVVAGPEPCVESAIDRDEFELSFHQRHRPTVAILNELAADQNARVREYEAVPGLYEAPHQQVQLHSRLTGRRLQAQFRATAAAW